VGEDAVLIKDPPGNFREKLKWLGPGFLWMVSAAGSGELLFTPRVGALYGYSLVWAMLAAVVLKWFINREVGRYTVCTGKTIIDGFGKLPGPKNWALYLILVPQLLVAVSTIAGLAGSSATALVLVLPGDIRIWTVVAILCSTALVLWGKFKAVEKVATVLAVALGVAAIIAAISVFPDVGNLLAGFLPKMPPDIEYDEIFPWLGFMLSGAAGMIWYSYWIQAKGYGIKKNEIDDSPQLNQPQKKKLKKWISQMTRDNTVAVGGTVIVTLSFLILGTELLKPKGIIPEENKVAEVLGHMLGHLWGPIGFWFMITAVFVGFWDTVLSDQDGFGRMFAGGTRLLLKNLSLSAKWATEKMLQKIFVIGLVTVAPVVLYLLFGEPVGLLKIAGAVEAAHIPILVVLILYLNHKRLPVDLRPSVFTFLLTALAGVFFGGFAIIYTLQVSGVAKWPLF
jgi:Mn2+/Fe2+ NRAMP family transporter